MREPQYALSDMRHFLRSRSTLSFTLGIELNLVSSLAAVIPRLDSAVAGETYIHDLWYAWQLFLSTSHPGRRPGYHARRIDLGLSPVLWWLDMLFFCSTSGFYVST